MNARAKILKLVAANIIDRAKDGGLVVAIDGVDGAGKTYFADELAAELKNQQQIVVRASIDGFHNPRTIRYRLGKDSPEGFFLDSYNYAEFRKSLLEPLMRGGTRKIRTAVFNHRTDSEIQSREQLLTTDSIVLIDGIFLHRSELLSYWGYSIFLNVPFFISIPRGAQRGEGSPDVQAPSNQRYIEGQRIYLSSCHPALKASIVINNSNLDQPLVET